MHLRRRWPRSAASPYLLRKSDRSTLACRLPPHLVRGDRGNQI